MYLGARQHGTFTGTTMKIINWDLGTAKEVVNDPNRRSACVDVVLNDGRTAQIVVWEDGRVLLRGWGNVPALLGNSTSLSFSAMLNYEEPTHDENYQPLKGK